MTLVLGLVAIFCTLAAVAAAVHAMEWRTSFAYLEARLIVLQERIERCEATTPPDEAGAPGALP